MKIYNYDMNGEFTSESFADPDPLEGIDEETGMPLNWLMPGNSTVTPPPAPMPGNARVFRDGKWGYVKVSDGPTGEQKETPHGPNIDDVVAARELRLETSFLYDFHDVRGAHNFGMTKQDMAGWDEVTKLASALIMSGQPDMMIAIKTNTGPVEVSAIEWQNVLIRAAQVRQPIFAASFALQAMSPIPSDYQDAKYWPEPLPPELPVYDLEENFKPTE